MEIDPFSDYAAVQDYLFGLKARGVKFGIDRMRAWSEAIGHPHHATPCIHIAGTNGKGSTAAILESIFRQAGWRTGLYTSPHLVRLGERVQVNRQALTDAEIVAYTNELRPVAEAVCRGFPDDHPSFFEFMTAMAFLQFARKSCDISFVEVGLGGRLDATTIVRPEISVITSIGLDHCEMLGETIEKIAWDKAGIIKPGRPVVLGRLPAEAENVIRGVAAEAGAPVHTIKEVFGEDLTLYPQTNLEGDYQRWNAATAVLVARLMPPRWNLSSEAIRRGLQGVAWSGRWERATIGGRPVIFDASHNPEGASVLEVNLGRLAAGLQRKPIVVVGVLGLARARPLIETICRYAGELHLVVPDTARACSHREMAALIPQNFTGKVHHSTVAGLFPAPERCMAGGPDDTVVITGSIYLLGEVLARIQPARGRNEGRLQDF